MIHADLMSAEGQAKVKAIILVALVVAIWAWVKAVETDRLESDGVQELAQKELKRRGKTDANVLNALRAIAARVNRKVGRGPQRMNGEAKR